MGQEIHSFLLNNGFLESQGVTGVLIALIAFSISAKVKLSISTYFFDAFKASMLVTSVGVEQLRYLKLYKVPLEQAMHSVPLNRGFLESHGIEGVFNALMFVEILSRV